MPKLPSYLIDRLGSLVQPYQRRNELSPNTPQMSVESDGEKERLQYHKLSEDGLPSDVKFTDKENPDVKDCYLWLVDKDCVKILFENTPCNTERGRAVHTNITGCDPAYHGGELWFVSETEIILNHDSGRYDQGTPEEKQAVKEVFEYLGFKIIKITERRL